MKRVFWIALGATAGILIARQITKTARNFTPDGAADRVAGAMGGLTQAIREFADDVKAGMAEREIELREALGIADNGSAAEVDIDRLNHMFDYNYSRGT